MAMGRAPSGPGAGSRPQQAVLFSFLTLTLGSCWGKACWEDAGARWFSLKMRKG